MDIKKLTEKLELIATLQGDNEKSHVEADKALLEYIDNKEVTEAFENIKKWYA